MLTDQKAQAVAQSGLAGARNICLGGSRRILVGPRDLRRGNKGSELFDGAEADSIGLAERSVNCSGLGHAHFSAADKRGNIRGVRISVSDESVTARRLVHCCFEDPSISLRVGEVNDGVRAYSRTPSTRRKTDQTLVSNVPRPIQKLQVASSNGESVSSYELLQMV